MPFIVQNTDGRINFLPLKLEGVAETVTNGFGLAIGLIDEVLNMAHHCWKSSSPVRLALEKGVTA